MKRIGWLRKKVANVYSLQLSAKWSIDGRNSKGLSDSMRELKAIADEVLEELESQKEG